jgi:hypothetical protein
MKDGDATQVSQSGLNESWIVIEEEARLAAGLFFCGDYHR